MNADEIRKDRDALSEQLAEVSNLLAALEVVSWQFCQISLEGEASQLRDAVVGISRSLAREVRQN